MTILTVRNSVAASLLLLLADASAAADDASSAYCAAFIRSNGAQQPVELPDEVRCLAMNVYFEARRSTDEGQLAVAYVVLNRASTAGYPSTICGVVHQGEDNKRGCQFSWVCDRRDHTVREHKAWDRSLQNSCRAHNAQLPDPTKGALIYHATTMLPDWAPAWQETTVIGGHVFYKPLKR